MTSIFRKSRRIAAALLGRTGFARLARLRWGAKLPVVLAYHSVAASEAAPAYVSPSLAIPRAKFREQLERLARRHVVVPLDRIHEALDHGRPSSGAVVALTFDDGYADNVELGLPELRAVGLPATIFATSAPLSGRQPLWTAELALLLERTRQSSLEAEGRSWPVTSGEERLDVRRALTRAWAVRTPEQVIRSLRALAERAELEYGQADGACMDGSAAREWVEAGMSLGGHTAHHPNLAYQPDAVVEEELSLSASDLEEIAGARPRFMAYPNCGGLPRNYTPTVKQLAADAGFVGCFTSEMGPIAAGADLLALPRLGVSRRFWNVDLLEAQIERIRFSAGNHEA